MPDFAYIARNSAGLKVTGKLSAASNREALATLASQALFPLEVKAERAAPRGRKVRISPQLVATLYGLLAGLLRSGVPLLRSLEVLRKQTSHVGLRDILADVRDQVEEGVSLADALAGHPHTFSEMVTSILRAGSEGGFLEDALEQIADFTEKQQDLKSRTTGALFYPVLLAGIGSTIVSALLIFVVPKFESLFTHLREIGELPALTDWLLLVSNTLQSWWLMMLGAAVAGGWFLRRQLQTAAGQRVRDRWKLKLPLVGPILLQLAVARFCRVLGTLLNGGVPIVRALTISSDATGNRILAEAIREAAENITAGQSLAGPLAASGHFPPDVVERIAVAEEANALDRVLIQIADSLERLTWRRLELAVRLIEPILLVVMAGVVMLVVIALVLPMLKMSMAV